MEISFHSHANKTHFHKKGCAPSLILKVRVFGPRKWPIITLVLTAAKFVVCFSSQLRSWISIWLINNSSIHYLKIKRLWILKGHKLSLPVRGLTQLHNSQTYRPLAFRLFLLLLLLFCFVFAMNNKLTIDFGFGKIWKRKKKKKRKKKRVLGWVGEISKIGHPILPQSTSTKKTPTHSTDCTSVNEGIILTLLFRSHFGIDYPKVIVLWRPYCHVFW